MLSHNYLQRVPDIKYFCDYYIAMTYSMLLIHTLLKTHLYYFADAMLLYYVIMLLPINGVSGKMLTISEPVLLLLCVRYGFC